MLLTEHHAQLYRASSLKATGLVVSDLEAKAEVYIYQTTTLTIDDVRSLIDQANRRPLDKDILLLVIDVDSIAREAQHALLKILEEPPETTKFLIIIRPQTQLLPTVISRCLEQQNLESAEIQIESNNAFNEFVQQTPVERISLIATQIKKEDKAWFGELENGLHQWLLRERPKQMSLYQYYITALRQRGAAKKMLWEVISLMLPVEKSKRS